MEPKSESKICIILLIGLPGSGKTTFCKEFIEKMPKILTAKNLQISHIELDLVENSLKKEKPKKTENFDSEIWKNSRDFAIQNTEDIIKKAKLEQLCNIILVDDNFYYESMRKPYIHLCQKYNIGLIQLVFKISEMEAKTRNLLREKEQQVENVVIERMSQKIEYPCENIATNIKCVEITKDNNWENLAKIIDFAFYNSVKDLIKESEELKEKDRKICKENIIHQIELSIRQEIGNVMKKMSKEDAKNKGKLISKMKENFMEDVNKSEKNKEINELLTKFSHKEIKLFYIIDF